MSTFQSQSSRFFKRTRLFKARQTQTARKTPRHVGHCGAGTTPRPDPFPALICLGAVPFVTPTVTALTGPGTRCEQVREHLEQLGYHWWEEDDNPTYGLFLKA